MISKLTTFAPHIRSIAIGAAALLGLVAIETSANSDRQAGVSHNATHPYPNMPQVAPEHRLNLLRRE